MLISNQNFLEHKEIKKKNFILYNSRIIDTILFFYGCHVLHKQENDQSPFRTKLTKNYFCFIR